MSYLSQPTSKTDYGVVKIGNNINVSNAGIISLDQDLSSNANVVFNSVTAANGNFTSVLTAAGNTVITSVTPTSGNGISLSNVVTSGYAAGFTITNTGVLRVIAGNGISVSNSTGNVVISSTGADLLQTYGTTTNYTLTLNDEYVGVSSVNNLTMTLPSGTVPDGRSYIIKDEYGQGSGKITIQPPAGTLIDGKLNYIISVPNQSVQVIYRAGGWWIV